MVRARTASDLPGCVEALLEVHHQDRYPTWWPEDPAGWLSPPGTVAAWVALDNDGAVLGHLCVVSPVDDPMVAETLSVGLDRLAAVSRLFVSPRARGRGLRLGTKLLAASGDWADAAGLRLMLHVIDDGAAAVVLYERLGWRLVDRRQADWLTREGARQLVRVTWLQGWTGCRRGRQSQVRAAEAVAGGRKCDRSPCTENEDGFVDNIIATPEAIDPDAGMSTCFGLESTG